MKKVTKKKNKSLSSLGSRIAYLRTNKNMSQENLAELLCIDRTKVNKIETDTRQPNIDELKKISTIFEVSTDYLLGLVPSMKSENYNISHDLGLSDSAIQNLKEAKKDIFLLNAIELFLENNELIKFWSEYLIIPAIHNNFSKNSFFKALVEENFQICLKPIEHKLQFFNLLECISIYRDDFEKNINGYGNYKDLIFAFYDNCGEEFLEENKAFINSLDESHTESTFHNTENYSYDIPSVKNTKAYQTFSKEYSKYKNKRNI